MHRLLAPSVLLIGLLAATCVSAQAPDAAGALHKAHPDVRWDAKSRKAGDFSCDGIADTALVGYSKGAVWLGLQYGGASGQPAKVVATRFAVGSDSQDSFCATPVSIELHPLICKTEDGPLPGCRPAKGCMAFSMVDKNCDAFHFYWDSSKKALTWWRN